MENPNLKIRINKVFCFRFYLYGFPAPLPVFRVVRRPPQDEVGLESFRPENVVALSTFHRASLNGIGESGRKKRGQEMEIFNYE